VQHWGLFQGLTYVHKPYFYIKISGTGSFINLLFKNPLTGLYVCIRALGGNPPHLSLSLIRMG